MSNTIVTDDMRQLAKQFTERFQENFLGSREDRDELTYWVMPASWRDAAEFLRDQGFDHLSDLTAVDYLDRSPRFDVMAIFSNQRACAYLRLKTVVDLGEPVDSLTPIWTGACWFEREIFDLFGIEFTDNPDQRRILLPKDYQGHPLRKDYPVTGPVGSLFR